MLESKFQASLITELKRRFEGCYVLKNDPNYIQGFPDLLILFGDRWAALEVKNSMYARRQVNQQWYVDHLNDIGFAAVIYPKNKNNTIYELAKYFGC